MSRGRKFTEGASLVQWFDDLKGDYSAAKTSRYRRSRTGVSGTGRHADYHYRTETDYLRLMELCRDIDRNDIVVGQGITRLVDNILQEGFALDPKTGDDILNADLAAAWAEFAADDNRCDVTGEHDFHSLEKLILRSSIVDGDSVVLGLREGSLQVIEAHRVRTPNRTKKNVVHGVLLSGLRRRLQYWVTKEDVGIYASNIRVGDVAQYDTRDKDGFRQVFHVYDPKRVSQTRGVSKLAPAADATGMHDDTQFANLVRLQMASCIAFLRMRESSFEATGGSQMGSQETDTLDDGTTRVIEGIAPGLEIIGNPGEKIEGFSPNIPNPEYFPFAMMILTFIAVNLGIPVQLLLLDPKSTNFSGWRGAMDQARIGFREMQSWFVKRFHQPVYRWFVRQLMAEDKALRARAQQVDVFAHRWNPPAWAYIEPLKDAKTDQLRVESCQTSPRRVQNERGRDWGEVTTEIVEDNALLITKAKETAATLNEQFEDEPVTWRDLLNPHGKAGGKPSGPPERDEPGQEEKETNDEAEG